MDVLGSGGTKEVDFKGSECDHGFGVLGSKISNTQPNLLQKFGNFGEYLICPKKAHIN